MGTSDFITAASSVLGGMPVAVVTIAVAVELVVAGIRMVVRP